MTSPEFSTLLTRSDVAAMLDLPIAQLTWWIWALDETRRYREFDIKRRNGEPRLIRAPIRPIKDIQRDLAAALTGAYSPPAHVHGFAVGRSPKSNASLHTRQAWVARVDLKDFFPSINFGRVRGMFMAFPFDCASDVATILAQICCHRNELPQGAPTSPIVSNLICRGMDKELARLARAERCRYTRFADDITFSTDRTVFPASIAYHDGTMAVAGPELAEIVTKHGFSINAAKTRLAQRTQRQRVTGLVVNARVNVPREYVRSLRNLLYIWRHHGERAAEAALARTEPHPNWPPDKRQAPFRLVVRGRVQYVGSVKGWSSPVYLGLAQSLGAVDREFIVPSRSPFVSPQRLRVYTEGPTDVEHLQAAIAYFQAQGEFTDLIFEWDASTSLDGDKPLRRFLGELPAQRPPVPSVCLFDRDNTDILKELRLQQRDWQDHGNGVVAAALVVPTFRSEPMCIEMLYSDEDLMRTDEQGRRVYLRSEFHERSGHHQSENSSIPNPKNKTLICDEVYEFRTHRSLALSKADFAASVLAKSSPFDQVSFEGFRPTLEMLVESVATAAAKVHGAS